MVVPGRATLKTLKADDSGLAWDSYTESGRQCQPCLGIAAADSSTSSFSGPAWSPIGSPSGCYLSLSMQSVSRNVQYRPLLMVIVSGFLKGSTVPGQIMCALQADSDDFRNGEASYISETTHSNGPKGLRSLWHCFDGIVASDVGSRDDFA